MQSLIKQLDFTTSIPNFYYDGEPRYKTVLGGIIQMIITIIWFGGIIYFSKDIYLRENPSVITSNEYDRIPYERNYTNLDDIMFMVSLNDPVTWAPFIDETYYTVKFITMMKQNQQRGQSERLKTERCRMEFFKGREDFVTGIPIENYFCLSPDIKNVTFKGTQTSPDSKYIKIGVHMCINSTENNNMCKTPEEIADKLAGSSFNLFFFNNKFETKNFTKPNEQFVDFHHSFYSNLYYKLVFVTLKQVRYIDDIGFFSETIKSKDYFAVNDIKEVFNFAKQPDGKFLDFAINFGTNRENIRRNYKKIQSTIAEVGGLFKGIYIIVIIFRTFLMKHYVYEYLNYFILTGKSSIDFMGYKQDGNFKFNKNPLNDVDLSNLSRTNLRKNEQLNKEIPFEFENAQYNRMKILSTTNNNNPSSDVNVIKFGRDLNAINDIENESETNYANNSELIKIKNDFKSVIANNIKNQKNSNDKIKNNDENFLKEAINIKPSKNNNDHKIMTPESGKGDFKFALNEFKWHTLNFNSNLNTSNKNDKNLQKLKKINTLNFYEHSKKFPKNFEVLATHYLSQKEILKVITDFTLLRSLIFNYQQNLEFEEMSRNIDFITKVMVEREDIFAKILSASEKKWDSEGKVDNSNMILRLKEII
jgi:hypothetical protein